MKLTTTNPGLPSVTLTMRPTEAIVLRALLGSTSMAQDVANFDEQRKEHAVKKLIAKVGGITTPEVESIMSELYQLLSAETDRWA